jgi:hypothetical protein
MLARNWDDGGGTLVKRSMIYTALAVLALSTPAAAQGYPPGGPPGAMAPYEILGMLRSTGFEPIGQPIRRGPNYLLRAIDERDREVSLVISARSGDILSVTPMQTASRMPPPPPGVSMGPYERMPPGYIPPGGPRGYGAPITDDDDDALPPPGFGYNAPRSPGAMPGAPLPRSSNAAPLPPRGGAIQPDDEDDASPPPGSGSRNIITADPDRSGMLPPPPERFPQRAAPAAPPKPKPVTRAAAAAPKAAPLPKAKPSAAADAPAAPAQQAWPSPPEPTKAPAKSPAVEETPN